jgi:GNAT superfamily N-acetyltransferase
MDLIMAAVTFGQFQGRQARALSHAMARAFDDDPWFRWLLPDPPKRYRALRRFFAATATDCRAHGRVDVAEDGDLVVGAAAWLPPKGYPPSGARQARLTLSVAAAVPAFPRRAPIAMRVLNLLQKKHPKEEHWYLALLGTDPSRWRRGIGSHLLEPVLAQADADGLPSYLETQAERNLAFYGKHGFNVTEELRVPGCPLPLWTMWRPARSM